MIQNDVMWCKLGITSALLLFCSLSNVNVEEWDCSSSRRHPLEPQTTDLETHMSPKATLYLDIDGVVNFFGSRNYYRKHSELGYLRRSSAAAKGYLYGMNWSNELLHRLDAIEGLEVALLSTWNSRHESLFHALQWSTHRVLGDVEGRYSDSRKFQELMEDQDVNPRPFIWADDTATSLATWLPAETEHLVLTPHEDLGLDHDDIAAIEDFVAGLH